MLTQVLFQVSMSVDDIVHFIIGQNKRVSIDTDTFTSLSLASSAIRSKIGIAVLAMTVTVFLFRTLDMEGALPAGFCLTVLWSWSGSEWWRIQRLRIAFIVQLIRYRGVIGSIICRLLGTDAFPESADSPMRSSNLGSFDEFQRVFRRLAIDGDRFVDVIYRILTAKIYSSSARCHRSLTSMVCSSEGRSSTRTIWRRCCSDLPRFFASSAKVLGSSLFFTRCLIESASATIERQVGVAGQGEEFCF